MKHSNINFLTLGFLLLVGIFLWGYYDLVQDCNQETYNYREQILRNQQEYLTLQSKKYNAITLLEKHRNDSALFQKSVQALKSELEQDTIAWRSGAEAMMRDTKSLIDLHLNAVDRQYNSLTLWAAVITILFLIFSFYAIFKLEDTLKQAKDAVKGFEDEANKKIVQVKEEADNRIGEIKQKSNQHMQGLNKKTTKLIKSLSDKAKAETEEFTKEANKQKEAMELSSEGVEHYNNKEYEKAIEKFANAAKLDPNDPSVYHKWGSALARLAQANDDIEMCEQSFLKFAKAIELKPDSPQVYNNWGNALVRLARINEDTSLFEQSFTKYAKAIELNPTYPEPFNNWGLALYHLGQLNKDSSLIKQSFTKFEKAIKLNPDYINAYKGYVNAIWQFARQKNKFNTYKSRLKDLLFKMEELKEGAGTYKLACFYSLSDEKDKAIEWLGKYLNKYSKVSKRTKYEQERDFDNIKSDPRFIELLDRYYSKRENSTTEK